MRSLLSAAKSLFTGDVAAARVVLLRAAEARDPKAALALAGTFDPIVLHKIGVYGIVGVDISSARSWYEKHGQLVSPTHRQVLLRGQHLQPAQGPDFDQRKDPTYGTGGIVHFVEVNPMPKAGGT